jgi:hypothetical protein
MRRQNKRPVVKINVQEWQMELFKPYRYKVIYGGRGWLCCMNRILYRFPLTPKYWFKRYA